MDARKNQLVKEMASLSVQILPVLYALLDYWSQGTYYLDVRAGSTCFIKMGIMLPR